MVEIVHVVLDFEGVAETLQKPVDEHTNSESGARAVN